MKFGIKQYWKPTPKKIRKLADAVISASVFAGTISSLNDRPMIATIIFVSGFVCKIVSNFFSEEETPVI
jgi:hypothetical protein